MDVIRYKEKKESIKNYIESDQCSERDKLCIKYLWGRRPVKYGVKFHYEKIVITWE
mgnify:CR=1|tara:strand:+ start:289 stop:456 length:168 start_codon:yes stop_codon:yes gene_type:complete